MRSYIKTISILIFLFVLNFNLSAQDKVQKIDELIQKYYDYGQFNGSILVAENGKVILDKGYGYANIEWKIPNTPETKFRLGSITKQFTSMLIMQLVEQGKIKLDGKITDYLPYYRKDIGNKVTIHNLLTHTSGIPNYTDDPNFMQNLIRNSIEVKDLVANYCSKDLEFEPGTKWNYSNSGYIILGAIIEQVTGKKYEDVLKENILIPLDMTNTGYDHSSTILYNRASGYDKSPAGVQNARLLDMSIPFAAGSMYSTVEDLYKWDQALYTDKLVSRESKEKIFTPVLNDYGYGWLIRDLNIVGDVKKKVISHSGGIFGFNTLIVRLVDDNSTIILLDNFSRGSLNDLSKGIARILYNQSYDMPKKSLSEIFYNSMQTKGVSEAIKEFNELKKNKDEYLANENEIIQWDMN